jgi:hypothetical protein
MKSRIEELARECVNGGPLSEAEAADIITTAVNEALELAAKACITQLPQSSGPTTALWDAARNTGIADCAEAIRKLKV